MEHYPCGAGFFDNSTRTLNSPLPDLSLEELFVVREIVDRLGGRPPIVIVGLGEMLASSLIAIATYFKEEVANGSLKFIATNKEAIHITDLLHEAEDGLFLPNKATLKFVKDNYNLVEYVSPVDTIDLENALSKLGVDAVDLFHEHFGGLFYCHNETKALLAISRLLKTNGCLFTMELYQDNCQDFGLKMEDIHSFGPINYHLYRKS